MIFLSKREDFEEAGIAHDMTDDMDDFSDLDDKF